MSERLEARLGGRRAELLGELAAARQVGLVGSGNVEAHVRHALGFAEAAGGPPGGPAVDLGSGGGLPGLVLALAWPGSTWTLLDARQRAVRFLQVAVEHLDLGNRVVVVHGRAEDVGRQPDRRGQAALVVARGFGPPAVTAECAAPLLRVGGKLVVSEPPDRPPTRWPSDGVALLGLRAVSDPGAYQVLIQVEPCPGRYPRRVGTPAKRPLF